MTTAKKIGMAVVAVVLLTIIRVTVPAAVVLTPTKASTDSTMSTGKIKRKISATNAILIPQLKLNYQNQ